MKLPLALLFLGAIAVAGAVVANWPGGYSGWPTFNGYKEADVIVEGRITGWDVVEPPNEEHERFVVAVHLDVARAVKGTVPPGNLDIIDSGSVWGRDGVYKWEPRMCDDCGPIPGFLGDPTGQYTIIGLDVSGGEFVESSKFYLGAEPDGPNYTQAFLTIDEERHEARMDMLRDLAFVGGIVGAVLMIGAGAVLARRRRDWRERRETALA